MPTPDDSLPFMDPDFWPKLACFSFFSWLKHGIGCCVIKEPPGLDRSKDIIEDLLDYVPYEMDSPRIPAEAIPMLDKYDPFQEVVLAITDKQTRSLAVQLSAQMLGAAPIDAYRNWSIVEGRGRFIAGELLYLKEPIDAVQPNHYVFLKREGAWMVICVAGLDEDEEACTTDQVVKVHSDFEESFTGAMGVIIPLRKVPPRKTKKPSRGQE